MFSYWVVTFQVIRAFESASGKTIPYEVVGRRKGDVDSLYASCDKVKKVTTSSLIQNWVILSCL